MHFATTASVSVTNMFAFFATECFAALTLLLARTSGTNVSAVEDNRAAFLGEESSRTLDGVRKGTTSEELPSSSSSPPLCPRLCHCSKPYCPSVQIDCEGRQSAWNDTLVDEIDDFLRDPRIAANASTLMIKNSQLTTVPLSVGNLGL